MSDATLPDPERWVEVYGDDLFRYALFRLRRRAAAEDVVQEAFLAALGARDSFDGRSTPKTWLIGILRHKIVDHIRKQARERPYEDVDIVDSSIDSFFDRKGHWKVRPAEWQVNPVKAFEQKEFRVVLEGCLSALQDRLRDAFVLREMEDRSAEEICKILDVSANNLWVMLYRARMRLRACLNENWFQTPTAPGA